MDRIDHVEEALSLLPTHLRLPKFEALVAGLIAPAQALEDTLLVAELRFVISVSEGALLDMIGELVDFPRDGVDDPTYRRYLFARLAALRSKGTAESLLAVADLVISGATALIQDPYRAYLPIGQWVPSGDIDTVLELVNPGTHGNTALFSIFEHTGGGSPPGTDGLEILSETEGSVWYNYWYVTGVTTVANMEAAITAHATAIRVKTAGAAHTFITGGGDEYEQMEFWGGSLGGTRAAINLGPATNDDALDGLYLESKVPGTTGNILNFRLISDVENYYEEFTRNVAVAFEGGVTTVQDLIDIIEGTSTVLQVRYPVTVPSLSALVTGGDESPHYLTDGVDTGGNTVESDQPIILKTELTTVSHMYLLTQPISPEVIEVLGNLLRTAVAAGVRLIVDYIESPIAEVFRLDSGPGLDQGKLAGAIGN